MTRPYFASTILPDLKHCFRKIKKKTTKKQKQNKKTTKPKKIKLQVYKQHQFSNSVISLPS